MNFARKVVLVVGLGFSLLSAYFTIWSYHSYLQNSEADTLLRLEGIANSLAVQINAADHEYLVKKYPGKDALLSSEQDIVYFKLHQLLQKTKAANMLQTEIYTLTIDRSTGKLLFIVSSGERPYFKHEYASYPAVLKEKYLVGGTINRYTDAHGEWLSAFAPVKDEEGRVVAIVQSDVRFTEFILKARQTALKNMAISLLIFITALAVIVKILNAILGKEEKDKMLLEAANKANESMSRELEKSLLQSTEINALRKEMIANISHDLRTPLATISGFAETLYLRRHEISPEDNERYLGIVMKESDRLGKILTELFELSRLESSQIKLNSVPFSIAELLQDVCQKYYILCNQQNIDLAASFSADMPYVLADIALIDRVLQNLVDNAIRYNIEGGSISIIVAESPDFVEVKISNTGPGIPPEEIDAIFDRYYKTTNSHAEHSTGLGLAIADKIMALHGSFIVVESIPDVNTTFCFKLPLYNKTGIQ